MSRHRLSRVVSISEAWKQWEAVESDRLIKLDNSLYNEALRSAVEIAWEDPTKEMGVQDLWKEVFPGVYETQFFDPERLAVLRDYLNRVAHAQIPLRPPYGISLNRGGAMLDSRSEGYLAAPNFQRFYQNLMNTYMWPIARLLFPDITGYDTQTFGFSIQWQPEKDTSLRAHTDASSVTLNINLNLREEEYSGSGERTNFVLWLYGESGQIPRPGIEPQPSNANQRWTVPTAVCDGFAPF